MRRTPSRRSAAPRDIGAVAEWPLVLVRFQAANSCNYGFSLQQLAIFARYDSHYLAGSATTFIAADARRAVRPASHVSKSTTTSVASKNQRQIFCRLSRSLF